MNLKDLKILLIQMDLKPGDLARSLKCGRSSIYHALNYGDRPGVLRKVRAWFDAHKRKVA